MASSWHPSCILEATKYGKYWVGEHLRLRCVFFIQISHFIRKCSPTQYLQYFVASKTQLGCQVGSKLDPKLRLNFDQLGDFKKKSFFCFRFISLYQNYSKCYEIDPSITYIIMLRALFVSCSGFLVFSHALMKEFIAEGDHVWLSR